MSIAAELDFPSEEYNLEKIPLEDIQKALSKNLGKFFKEVSVSVSDCPDLSQEPYNLATDGIGGESSTLLDIGGPPYVIPLVNCETVYNRESISSASDYINLTENPYNYNSDSDEGGIPQPPSPIEIEDSPDFIPLINRENIYDLKEIIPKYVGSKGYPNGWYACGAAASTWSSQGSNCEMIVNIKLDKQGNIENNKSRVAMTSPGNEEDLTVRHLGKDECSCALLSNVFVSSGKGRVLQVKCSVRLDQSKSFTGAIREALRLEFGDAKPIALGGLFKVTKSNTKIHVIRDYSEIPLQNDEDVNNWLKFFEIRPPMLFQSILVSSDPGMDLRIDHSHGWRLHENGEREEAGHYHYDDMPDTVEYHGIYATAQKIIRIDRPEDSSVWREIRLI